MRALRVVVGSVLLSGAMVAASATSSSSAPPGAAGSGAAGSWAAASGTTASAAGALTQVTNFGTNPGNLAMYEYVPAGLPAGAPTVVALHGCTQSAAAYHQGSGWSQLADEYGFAVVYPQQSSGNNANSCFNFFEAGDTTRGQGEAASIAQMVTHARSLHSLGSDNTFVTGLSAGGGMTSAMLATYPDLFAGGSVVAGLPFRCATSMVDAFGCMSNPPDRTPQQWGALARDGYPGHSGPRPKVAVWHGTSDTTVVPANARELVDQFTDVAGVSRTATETTTLSGGTTRRAYGDEVVEYSVQRMGHGTPVDPGSGADQCGQAGAYFLDTICSARHDAAFFGISAPVDPGDPGDPGDPDPEPGACVTASNYDHTVAGRAHQSGGMTFANGSGDAMGLWNVFTTTELEETAPGYWEVGC
ncbi:extracellular catalytic domain type 1 short-chain-length polyhydroxyalkanoate depolymerase [Janibacter sp. G368]|uniref:extracellular catalytic domain type 1 short-chain-length polyhydroxyalkanoate depolymerase n=1 Tax=Janibacter sp. G368 TaxID=3420441 RepID=UPI003CFED787